MRIFWLPRLPKTFLAILIFLLAIGEALSAQQVLTICSAQANCPGLPAGTVQAIIDSNGWRNFKLTLTQNVTSFSFVGIPPPTQASVNVIFTEDGTGGRTVTFASSISNPCTITTTANATTLCQFEFDGTVGTWFGISGSGGGTCAQGTCVVNAPSSTQTITSSATQDLKFLSSATNSFIDITPKDPTFGVPIITLDSEATGDTAINFNKSGANDFSFYHHGGGTVLAVAEQDIGGIDVLNISSGVTSLHQMALGDAADVGHTVSGQIQWFGATSGNCIQSVNSTGATMTIGCPVSSNTFNSSGSNGGITGTEGTGAALTPAGGVDLLYPDSTNHCWHENLNGVDFGCTQTVVNLAASGFILPNIIGGYTQGVSTLVEATNEMECMRSIAPATLSGAVHFTYMPTTSAGAATHVGFAIYNSAGSTRIATTGALDGTLTGQQVLTITAYSLSVGNPYLFCWTTDAAAPGTWATGAYTTGGSVYANLYNASGKNLVKGANASVAGAPPTTLGALTAITAVNIPVAFVEP